MADFIRVRHQIVDQLRLDLENEGYRPESPEFESLLLQRKVETCQQTVGVPVCGLCPAFDGCAAAKQHLRHIRFGTPRSS